MPAFGEVFGTAQARPSDQAHLHVDHEHHAHRCEHERHEVNEVVVGEGTPHGIAPVVMEPQSAMVAGSASGACDLTVSVVTPPPARERAMGGYSVSFLAAPAIGLLSRSNSVLRMVSARASQRSAMARRSCLITETS